jgi:hypothetical protein
MEGALETKQRTFLRYTEGIDGERFAFTSRTSDKRNTERLLVLVIGTRTFLNTSWRKLLLDMPSNSAAPTESITSSWLSIFSFLKMTKGHLQGLQSVYRA